MRFEYELQGDFDEILMCIDRAVMIDARDTKDLSADDERTVVRNYDSGVEFTLKKSGENINIAVTGEQDRLFGGNIYFDLIKDAVEDYRSGRYGGMDTVRYFAFDVCENTADSIDELYGTADNIQQHYDASDVISEIEDVRKNDIESVATQVTSEDCSEESTTENVPENIEENIIENSTENIGCNTNVSVDGEESEEEIDVATASKNDEDIHTSESKMVRTSNRTIDLVCQCDYDYENELFKSTYENISEDMWYPLDSASERDYYVILNNWWKKNSYVNKIAKKAESIVKIPGYDYISLVRGMVCLLAGIIICVVIPVGTGENSVFSYSMTVIC